MEDVDIYNEINSNENEDEDEDGESEIKNEEVENECNEIEQKDEEDFEQELSSINSNKKILDRNPNEKQIDKLIIFLQQNNLLVISFICDECNAY